MLRTHNLCLRYEVKAILPTHTVLAGELLHSSPDGVPGYIKIAHSSFLSTLTKIVERTAVRLGKVKVKVKAKVKVRVGSGVLVGWCVIGGLLWRCLANGLPSRRVSFPSPTAI